MSQNEVCISSLRCQCSEILISCVQLHPEASYTSPTVTVVQLVKRTASTRKMSSHSSTPARTPPPIHVNNAAR